MTSLPQLTIGPFVMGEKPSALQYTYLDTNNVAIDITGYVARIMFREKDSVTPITRNATVVTPTGGIVSYAWQGDEFATPGHYLIQFWIGNGATRLASALLVCDVSLLLTPAPAI